MYLYKGIYLYTSREENSVDPDQSWLFTVSKQDIYMFSLVGVKIEGIILFQFHFGRI